MDNIIFNWYDADIRKNIPLGTVSLSYLLNAIKKPKKDIRYIFEQIRQADEDKDVLKKQQLKTKLYSFTPCVLVNGARKYDNIIKFNGIIMLDFDKMESVQYAKEFKEYLFNKNKFIISSWLSASKRGVRAVMSIPICNSVDEFKHYFNAIEMEFKSYIGFDAAPKNCVLPLFISYDPEILIRTDYTTWKQKHIPIIQPPVIQYNVTDKSSVIEKIIAKRIDTITDSGHGILRATSFTLGGYVSAGYCQQEWAMNLMNKLIDSHHYLRQKAHVYKKTSNTMIKKGMLSPIYLSK